ncbi:MAG: efflux transporter outer membrane subunit [Cyclobacteriaceae bacterium]|nr:efflux transporter outer membrane subunit [Cyclobacteriaceae bacterium]UYN87108.1 MAG: efflux transporter outer membrane subunit [Cyclobacteriaceae bacterium]
MKTKIIDKSCILVLILLSVVRCKAPDYAGKTVNKNVPETFMTAAKDTGTVARLNWRTYFADPNLVALIDTALKNNQELNILLMEIEVSKNEVKARKGEYLPFVRFQAEAGLEKPARYTPGGAVEESLEIKPGTPFPEPLHQYGFGLSASWELDVWKKLRNAKKAALNRYLATMEARNFMVTNMVAEIAETYYELMALDNLLNIIQQNIAIQTNALSIVEQQKAAAKVTQLAVNRFEAQLLNTKNLQYEIRQRIVETENRIHFLTGSFPKAIRRNSNEFLDIRVDSLQVGIPAQLLKNRPDIRQAEFELAAAQLDVKVARAMFYPSLGVDAGLGFAAFKPTYLIKPESMLYNFAGGLMAPVLNRNAIQATFNTANAKQVKQIYQYERSVLNAYLEVANELSRLQNYSNSLDAKGREVEILTQSVTISNNLFMSARADYLEVLLTQREALESRMELIEIKRKQIAARIGIYKSLGGGWQ